jgi:hypothetical protein
MDKRIQKVLGLVESIDDRTPKKTDGIQRSYHKLMHMINKDVEGTFGDYMGESVEVVEDETAVEESIVARVQGGRKMVSAEAALRHARELANKRAPGSKPTMSDIAAAHRRLTSGVKHESEEIDELSNDLLSRYKKAASADSIAADKAGDTKKADKRFSGVMRATKKQFANDAKTVSESFAVKDASGKTVTVKYSENDAKKVAEELTKKTGQKHSVKYERTATVKEDTDGKDTVVLEIPALIRALEWAREDAEDDVEIHKFVEKLINHEGTVDMEFFSEEVIPSADRKVDKNGRPYPAHRVQVGTNESRKASSTYEISYDYGPHMSKTVSISAKSEKEAEKEVIRTAAKEGHRNIMINWIRKDVQVGTNESETLKVGDTVWAKDQKLSYKTHSGKILSISKETVTIKLKSGATQTFPKKAVSSDFETLNPYKRTDESIDESYFPQEAVGKSNKKIAEMLADDLKRVGIKLIKADPFPGQKGTIWSVESSQYPDQVVTLEWSARTPGGRGINKPKNINLSFTLFNKDGTIFEPTKMNRLNSIAAITFDGIGRIYKERVE